MIWFIFAFLALLASVFIIFPLLRKDINQEVAFPHSNEELEENILAFKDQELELNLQLSAGIISDVDHSELLLEQRHILALDLADETKPLRKINLNRGAWLVLASLLLMPVCAFSLYNFLGASTDLHITDLLKKRASILMNDENRNSLSVEIQEKMSSRLLDEPDHPFYRSALAQLQMEGGDFAGAKLSYSMALVTRPNDSELLSEYAQAAYFSEDKKFNETVNLILDKALLLDSGNKIALGLQGIRFFELGDYGSAVKSWENALLSTPMNTPESNALELSISYARKFLKENKDSLSVKVTLSPEYKLRMDAVVYVYVKEWGGSSKPLAAVKLAVKNLPAIINLEDDITMMSKKNLSSFEFVEVVARVSMSGLVTPSSGDYEGSTGKIRLKKGKVALIQINKQL
ncbi:MAG: cytochrome c-type biogenesis protein CcmH [Saprospiraceae bacterium]|jgi:cytochrome c-type biogenesis protein CcmH|tara:strand:- start:293 stop:1504 length:1212 start_codon:yes stop_codon:yes gene_type:complete